MLQNEDTEKAAKCFLTIYESISPSSDEYGLTMRILASISGLYNTVKKTMRKFNQENLALAKQLISQMEDIHKNLHISMFNSQNKSFAQVINRFFIGISYITVKNYRSAAYNFLKGDTMLRKFSNNENKLLNFQFLMGLAISFLYLHHYNMAMKYSYRALNSIDHVKEIDCGTKKNLKNIAIIFYRNFCVMHKGKKFGFSLFL